MFNPKNIATVALA